MSGLSRVIIIKWISNALVFIEVFIEVLWKRVFGLLVRVVLLILMAIFTYY